MEEAIRFLQHQPLNQQKFVIKEYLESITHKPGEKIYNTDTIVRAFRYYASSRSWYEKLRKDYKLTSTKTLRNLTSKVSKI